MTEQLKEIGLRLRALREDCDVSEADMAARVGMSELEYAEYERGERDFSFSFMHTAANILGVDVLDLLSGESPHLSTMTLIRGGDGFSVDRRAAYAYKHLAYTFRGKKADPFIVTVTRGGEEPPVAHAHDGQEFNYILSGRVIFFLGEETYELNAGDSLYFNCAIPHAMKTPDDEARFLAVVIN
ncbi:MAG: XRE family transcriptional regulator [Clostridiales bacterium]|jgi:transcriptional regulator with XRE-family HTH domain|nr:XRE family transcriptional regulator [Clostridiales bacterium]